MNRPDGKTWLRAAAIVVATAAYLGSVVTTPGPRHRVLIPADCPFAVTEPMRVDVLDESGHRGIRIPAHVGRGWCNEAGGLARYRCYIPAQGIYTLWAYCLWSGACTNAVYVQIDGSDRVILGNDPSYHCWHWVRGVAWPLDRGSYTVTLSNHSDGIAIQRLLLLSDPLDRPEGGRAATYDLFYDGFDGCDGGNITAWSLTEPHWQLVQPQRYENFDRRVLAGRAPESGPPAVAVVGNDEWTGYAVDLSMQVLSPGRVGLAFEYHDTDNCVLVQCRVGAAAADPATVRLIRRINGRPLLLGECEAPLTSGCWQHIGLAADGRELSVAIDGKQAGRIPFASVLSGRLALLLADGAEAWFDDVHVRLTGDAGPQAASIPLDGKARGCAADSCTK